VVEALEAVEGKRRSRERQRCADQFDEKQALVGERASRGPCDALGLFSSWGRRRRH
jgi:hypothetical protein